MFFIAHWEGFSILKSTKKNVEDNIVIKNILVNFRALIVLSILNGQARQNEFAQTSQSLILGPKRVEHKIGAFRKAKTTLLPIE